MKLLYLCLFLIFVRSLRAEDSLEELPSALLPLEARNKDNDSQEEEVISTSYVLPNQIFNDGKPYYAGKDPISGQFDFSAKKTAGIENNANEVIDDNEKVVLASASPNIHDYLNLPVKYSSSKFVYPLVSSSYANLKYQGSNKNFITNKKPSLASITPSVNINYNNPNYYNIQTTKLMPVPPTASTHFTNFTTTNTPKTTTTTTTTTTTSAPKTVQYTTTTRRTTTTTTPAPTSTTTRKKYVPTKKYIPTTSTNTVQFPKEQTLNNANEFFKPTSTTLQPTTHPSVTQQSFFPANETDYKTSEIPAKSDSNFKLTQTKLNTAQKQKPLNIKPPMTLDDLFNSLAEEESAVVSNYQGNQGFDVQGNLIQPISPSQPSPFAQNSQHQQVISNPQKNNQQPETVSEHKVFSASQENYGNEYVSYQVQQPNMMQYRPAPGSINNVVISPGQQSASFVLGSQQQVGNNAYGSVEKQPLFSKETLQYGTVLNDDINSIKKTSVAPPIPTQSQSNFHQPAAPTNNYVTGVRQEEMPVPPSPYQQLPVPGSNMRPKQPVQQQNSIEQHNFVQRPQTSVQEQPAQDTKELLVGTNIRFPTNAEERDELTAGSVVPGPETPQTINGHAQPFSLQQLQGSNPNQNSNSNAVVFPKSDENSETASNEHIQIQQHEVLTMNQHKQKLGYTGTTNDGTPAQHMTPPARFPQPPHRTNGPPPPPPPFAYNELNRKSMPGINRPNADRTLPNILPQFRPNAKISNGNPNVNFNQEPGNIHLTNKRPTNLSPQFAHRRQTLLQQKRFPMNRISEYPAGPPPVQTFDKNRRFYRLPPYGGPQNKQYHERMHLRRPPPTNFAAERHAANNQNFGTLNMLPNEPKLSAERLAAFEEEDLVINEPPQPVAMGKDYNLVGDANLEPVITLQMLQSQKKSVPLDNEDTGSGEIQVPSPEVEKPISTQTTDSQNGLFIVYPVKGSNNVEGFESRDPLPAIAHIETSSEYQNTPFSVRREQPQEPILKNKKPQSLQQQTKSQLPKEKFPYHIEKPDPSYTELNPAALIRPRIINTGNTEASIAYAYTPTTQHYNQVTGSKYSNVKLATSVINEIRSDTQTEESPSNIYDVRGQSLEHNFMAPFYPSVSLSSITNVPASGWHIIPSTTDNTIYEKNHIDRADVYEDMDTTTVKSFELGNFQPELQGGFKPIYPPGYQLEVEKEDQVAAANNMPIALASRMDPPIGYTSTTSTTSPAGAVLIESKHSTTTPIPIKAENNSTMSNTTSKKSVFESNLETLLFGNEEEALKVQKEKLELNKNGSRNVPRMGPRNMKLR